MRTIIAKNAVIEFFAKKEADMRLCIHCKQRIPQARVDLLPETMTCVNCSDEPAKTEMHIAEPCSVEPREVQYEENR